MRITVTGADSNIVHRNHFLISANSSEEAYGKAEAIGKHEETAYKNPKGQDVLISFIGIADLDEIHDDIGDGAEVLFHYQVDVSKEELGRMIPEKARLRAFAGLSKAEGPDYASAEVVALVEKASGINRPD